MRANWTERGPAPALLMTPRVSYGQTDEFGRRAIENPTTIYDLHATILHLLGIDQENVTDYHIGFERRLTDVHGHVIRGTLA